MANEEENPLMVSFIVYLLNSDIFSFWVTVVLDCYCFVWKKYFAFNSLIHFSCTIYSNKRNTCQNGSEKPTNT